MLSFSTLTICKTNLDQGGPFWLEEVCFGPCGSASHTVATPELKQWVLRKFRGLLARGQNINKTFCCTKLFEDLLVIVMDKPSLSLAQAWGFAKRIGAIRANRFAPTD